VEPFDLLKMVAEVSEQLGIRYVTVGSLATIAYGVTGWGVRTSIFVISLASLKSPAIKSIEGPSKRRPKSLICSTSGPPWHPASLNNYAPWKS
jgi:hypothetical protein